MITIHAVHISVLLKLCEYRKHEHTFHITAVKIKKIRNKNIVHKYILSTTYMIRVPRYTPVSRYPPDVAILIVGWYLPGNV